MLKASILALALFGSSIAEVIWEETFKSDPLESNRWVVSNEKKDSGEAGTWEYSGGLWGAEERKGLRTSEDAKFYSISADIGKTFNNEGKTLAFGFRVKHEQKIDCGGGYAKLLRPGLDQANFNGDTEYTIMFGPDICGYSTKIVHTIFNHDNTNLLKKSEVTSPDDEYTHSYALVVTPDDKYEIYVDGESKASGNMKDDWDFEKPKKIKDPNESKPEDWVDEPMMDDPDDVKPEGYDDIPKQIADPDAEQPDDWDEEEDGQWEAPMVDNPEYKGPWTPKKIKNPDYKGEWVHPEIDNPEYVEQKDVYKRGDVGAVGIEVWQVKAGTVFSDFVLADSYEDVKAFFDNNPVDLDKEKEAKKKYDDSNSPKEDEEGEDETETETETETDESQESTDEEPEDKEEI